MVDINCLSVSQYINKKPRKAETLYGKRNVLPHQERLCTREWDQCQSIARKQSLNEYRPYRSLRLCCNGHRCLLKLYAAFKQILLCRPAYILIFIKEQTRTPAVAVMTDSWRQLKVIELNLVSDGKDRSTSHRWDATCDFHFHGLEITSRSNLCADSTSLISTSHKCLIVTMSNSHRFEVEADVCSL